MTLINLGETLTKLGHYSEALTHLQAGLQLIQAQEAKGLEASAYKYFGMLYRAMGEPEQAVVCFDCAIALAEELGMPVVDEWRELRAEILT